MSAAPQMPLSPNGARRIPFALTSSALAVGSAVLAACATPPPTPPPPPPPPPAVVEAVPYRPLPPGGAHYVMDIPGAGQTDGA